MKQRNIQNLSRKNAKSLPGFTLIEVLISTIIFSIVMFMTSSIVSQSTSYQSKIKTLRDASEDSGRISDNIARDIKAASGQFKLVLPSGANRTLKNGVALLSPSDDFASSVTTSNISPTLNSSNYTASTLIISTKDSIIVYTTGSSPTNAVYSKTFLKSDPNQVWWQSSTNTLYLRAQNWPNQNLLSDIVRNVSSQQVSGATLETEVRFAGFTASSSSTVNAQSYVSCYVHSRTKNYDAFAGSPNRRSETYIRSTVTTRSYAN